MLKSILKANIKADSSCIIISWVIISMLFLGTYSGICIKPGVLYAAVPDMDMSATPNPVGSGARALGIGGAFISVADDATAASWNPGGLLQLKKPEFSFVWSHLSGRVHYMPSESEWKVADLSPDIHHLNYLSLVFPFILFRRNFVTSVNYQHLYEFSLENSSVRRGKNVFYGEKDSLYNDIIHRDFKYQRGSLSAVSPALAIQVMPSLFLGLTCNFWDIADNGWENLNVQNETGLELGLVKVSHSEVYEKYDFSGFNLHFGFLFKSGYHSVWGKERRFRVGGVVKTPFSADIRNEKRVIAHVYYPDSPDRDDYQESVTINDLTLKMPLSYGIGFSADLSDTFSVSLDIYRTHWEDYLLCYPSGTRRSPVNKRLKEEAGITSTTQVRIGAEYIIEKSRKKIPIRIGAFYDPEPAGGSPDDFYGISLGWGIIYKERFCLDLAYQFRFGEKDRAENIQTQDIHGRIKQHYFYASVIYYLF